MESRDYGPLHSYFVDAGKELKMHELDLNAPQRTGLIYCIFIIHN